MSKAFVRETEADGEADVPAPASAPAGRNYLTPAGFARLKAELRALVERERPQVVQTVSWAAANGDRSENGDYLYGKRRLREIDRRVRFLVKRLESAQVVPPGAADPERVFFGASVTVAMRSGERTVTIVGIDEADPAQGRISWISPLARALLRARAGDRVTLRSPAGAETIDVIEVRYASETEGCSA